MPKKTARPRARKRSLEGLTRMQAIWHSRFPPYENQRDCNRAAWEWLEIREDAIATGAGPGHFMFDVIERGVEVPAPHPSVLHLATDGRITAEDRARDLAIRTERSRATAEMVRAAWETLTATTRS